MATLDTTTNPSDKVEQQANTRGDQTRTGRRVQNAYPYQLPQHANLWRPRQWKNYLCRARTQTSIGVAFSCYRMFPFFYNELARPHQGNCFVKPAIVVLVQYLQLMALNLDFDSGNRRAQKAPMGYTF